VRLNVGCGDWPLTGFVNLDRRKGTKANIRADAGQLPFADETVDEVYAGHMLEHLEPAAADEFLSECRRTLKPVGRLGVLVPDMRAVFERYASGRSSPVEYPPGMWRDVTNLDDCCAWFIYSTLQESPHRWCYDLITLRRKLERNGFRCTTEINRWFDPRVILGAWYQCGWDAVKEA